jgi:seryl-tRNA synthetase
MRYCIMVWVRSSADLWTNNPEKYEADQIGSRINALQKEIGQKMKAKQDATDLRKQREDLLEQKKRQEELAAEKNNGTDTGTDLKPKRR